MPFWLRLSGIPLYSLGLGVLTSLLFYPRVEMGSVFFVVAVLWVMFTGKARKTYFNARLRARAGYDERRAQSAR